MPHNMLNNRYSSWEQRNITVKHAYGGGIVKLSHCEDCGATVIDDRARKKHDEFHDKIDELIDWAQNVSEYFVERHGTPAGGGIREILHRINDGIIAPGEAMARSGIELQKGPDTPD